MPFAAAEVGWVLLRRLRGRAKPGGHVAAASTPPLLRAQKWRLVSCVFHSIPQRVDPKSGSYPVAMSRSGGSHGGSGRVIFATT